MNPEHTPNSETVAPMKVVLDGDTLSGNWNKLYRTFAKKNNFSYFLIDSAQQLGNQLELAKLQSTQLLIILSGQQLYDGQQDQWLQLITEEGFRENIVVITGHDPNSKEWKYVANKYQLKLMYKETTGFGKNFQNLLEAVALSSPI